jgi:hypothetical protein
MPGEDRLTEIFAFVLSRDAALVRELCARAGVPFGADYRVATQRLTRDGDFADMDRLTRRWPPGRIAALRAQRRSDDGYRQRRRDRHFAARAVRRRRWLRVVAMKSAKAVTAGER